MIKGEVEELGRQIAGLSRGAHLHALSGQGPFQLWRFRAHCQGFTAIY